eukprot:Hpha_TRINITY_DN19546_c0_g1::TRINITY_DN19546_c0_g1_i1::g.33604::m.33604
MHSSKAAPKVVIECRGTRRKLVEPLPAKSSPLVPRPSPAGLESDWTEAPQVGIVDPLPVDYTPPADLAETAASAAGVLTPDTEPPTPDQLRKGLAGLPKAANDTWPGPRGSVAGRRVVEPHRGWGMAGAIGSSQRRPQTAPSRGRPRKNAVPMEMLMNCHTARPPLASPAEFGGSAAGSAAGSVRRHMGSDAEPTCASPASGGSEGALAGELAAVVPLMPDAVTGACALLDCAAELPQLAANLAPGWRALFRVVRDTLLPAVLADAPPPPPPLSPGLPRGRWQEP